MAKNMTMAMEKWWLNIDDDRGNDGGYGRQGQQKKIAALWEMAKKMAASRLLPPTFVFLFFFSPILQKVWSIGGRKMVMG
nr:hypothetical protein Iba_chr13bCG9760 [Ipomoea batatas]